MAQRRIIEFLEQHKTRFFTMNEISEAIKLSKSAVARALKQLRRYKEVDFRVLQHAYANNKFVYGFKRPGEKEEIEVIELESGAA